MMYPVMLNLAGKPCLVVGGGRIAVRKTISLLRAGASVVVVARECCRRMRTIAPLVTIHERPFDENDVTRDYLLAIGATDDQEVNRALSRISAQCNLLCNIVDQPDLCSFIVPAVVRRKNITVAVSTDAVAPRMARYLKTVVAQTIGPLHGELAAYLGDIRRRIRVLMPSITDRSRFWETLFAADPIDEINRKGWDAFRHATENLIDASTRKAVPDE